MIASGSTHSTSASAATRSTRLVARSSWPFPMTAFASRIAPAPASSINGVAGTEESHSLVSPVNGSDSRNSASAAASTGASTPSTTITSRWSVATSASRSRKIPTADPNAKPASIQPNQLSLSNSLTRLIPIRSNNPAISQASANVTPTNASDAAPMTASVQAWPWSRA